MEHRRRSWSVTVSATQQACFPCSSKSESRVDAIMSGTNATDDHKKPPPKAPSAEVFDQEEATQMTCDVLCALSNSNPRSTNSPSCDGDGEDDYSADSKRKGKACPRQLQLPMFLSKTYHMIDRCDPEIATWSESGDNFVVKNVEKFASNVLPLYFKHSNFSSFARQLNFYGFRKLRTDPILTSDVDPRTVSYVRFYHEKFQRGKPELLHQIKRATKTDQQSKDDVESLKQEVARLKETVSLTTIEYDRKLAELSYECNRRITAMNAEYDKLAALVKHTLGEKSFAAAASMPDPVNGQMPDLLHSLSQAAVTLQNHLRQPGGLGQVTGKRPSDNTTNGTDATRPRFA